MPEAILGSALLTDAVGLGSTPSCAQPIAMWLHTAFKVFCPTSKVSCENDKVNSEKGLLNMTEPEIFILTTKPPERPGGVERFVSTFIALAERHEYKVRVFHRENCAPSRWRNPFLQERLSGFLLASFKATILAQLVLSNGSVGWFLLGDKVKQVHFLSWNL